LLETDIFRARIILAQGVSGVKAKSDLFLT